MEIYDVLGELVKTLVDEKQPVGDYTIQWSGRDNEGRLVASGVYRISLRAGEFAQMRKMVLIR